MHIEPSDRDLIGALPGDPEAFEIFYRRHIDRVIGFAARRVGEPEDVADLAASTFLTVLTSAGSYDSARGEPSAWLLGITARLIANRRRRRGRELAATARIRGRELIDQEDVDRLEERIDAERLSQDVERALVGLRPQAREALLLVGRDGLSTRDAAGVAGVSDVAFRVRLARARRSLRARLADGPQSNPARLDEPLTIKDAT